MYAYAPIVLGATVVDFFAVQGLGGGLPLGRGRAPWEGQEQGRGMGQGRLFRAVGWDEQTGTHLLLSVPGVEEDTPFEQYLQVRRLRGVAGGEGGCGSWGGEGGREGMSRKVSSYGSLCMLFWFWFWFRQSNAPRSALSFFFFFLLSLPNRPV